ncbi:GNAT family N-acetyltransferase [Peribacillus sp. SCS-37]|uniref:GNAT family N-acetyltransferase n=1 Tax=Paraperibacillus esterisolvens TaxID=3115296 RepID=UPI0039064164
MNLITVHTAELKDFEEIATIDKEVFGSSCRRSVIKKAIEGKRCIKAVSDDRIAGFLIYDLNFFEQTFISLIIVPAEKRRKGYASSLLGYMAAHSPTQKIFSSTNQSNTNMQKVFKANGFTLSGIIENLDDGDPEIIFFKTKNPSQ